MMKNFKKFKELKQYERDEFGLKNRKQKKRMDFKEKMRLKADLKAHFPDRVWGIPNERKKGPKI